MHRRAPRPGPGDPRRRGHRLPRRSAAYPYQRLDRFGFAVRDRQIFVPKDVNREIAALRITQRSRALPRWCSASSALYGGAAGLATGDATRPRRNRSHQPTAVLVAGPWKLVGGPEQFESAAVESLAAQLSNLRAERWLPAAHEQPAPRLSRWRSTGRPRPDDRPDNPARLVPARGALRGQRALADAAAAEFRFRTVLPEAGADIRMITVTTAAGAVSVERDDAGATSAPTGRRSTRRRRGRCSIASAVCASSASSPPEAPR